MEYSRTLDLKGEVKKILGNTVTNGWISLKQILSEADIVEFCGGNMSEFKQSVSLK